jgi:hypothetical protein
LIAALWADAPEGTSPRVTAQAQKSATAIATKFAELITPFYAQVTACSEYGSHPDAGSVEAALGHDLYLTSAGHGVGFWSREELSDEVKQKIEPLVGWHKAIGEPELCFMRGWMYLDVRFNGEVLL